MKYYECEDGDVWVNLDKITSIYIMENDENGDFNVVASEDMQSERKYLLNTFKSLEEAKQAVNLILDDKGKSQCSHSSDAKVFLSHAIEFLSEIEVDSNGAKLSLQIAERLISKALTVLEANDG